MCFLVGTGGCAWEADMRPLPGKVPAGRCHGPKGRWATFSGEVCARIRFRNLPSALG